MYVNLQRLAAHGNRSVADIHSLKVASNNMNGRVATLEALPAAKRAARGSKTSPSAKAGPPARFDLSKRRRRCQVIRDADGAGLEDLEYGDLEDEIVSMEEEEPGEIDNQAAGEGEMQLN